MARLSCDIARGVDRARSPSSFRWPSQRNRQRKRLARRTTSPRFSRSPGTSGRGTTTTSSRRGRRDSCSPAPRSSRCATAGRTSATPTASSRDGEVFLLNLHISPYERGGYTNHEPARTRKLLLHRKEIRRLIGAVERAGTHARPARAVLQERSGQGGAGAGQGKEAARQARHRANARRRARDGARGAHADDRAARCRAPDRGGVARARRARRETASCAFPTVASADGPMVRPDRSARCSRSRCIAPPASTYTLDVWGARLRARAGRRRRARRQRRASARDARRASRTGTCSCRSTGLRGISGRRAEHRAGTPRHRQLVVFGTQAVGRTGRNAPARDVGDGPAAGASSREQLACVARPTTSAFPPVPSKRHRLHVIVDAGHGGVDNGMTRTARRRPQDLREEHHAGGGEEARRPARVARRRRRLHAHDATRSSRSTIAAGSRIARRGSLFISIHVNAANPNWKDPRGSRGFETYFLVRSENRRRAARRADGKRRGQVRGDARQDRQGRSAELHPERHAAERAPARVERARGDSSSAGSAGCTRVRAAA